MSEVMEKVQAGSAHLEQVQPGKLVRVPIAVWEQLQAIRVQVAQSEGVIIGSFGEIIQRLIDEHNGSGAGK